jgi:hypothetical protein
MTDLLQISEATESALENVLDCDCRHCDERPLVSAVVKKILAGWERRLVLTVSASGQQGLRMDAGVTHETVHALRILARANEPVQGAVFERLLSLNERSVKGLMKQISEEWLIPVIATRKPPYGYFVAASAAEYLEWERVMRSQAISMLARCRRLFKANFPELAGQEHFDFIRQVSSELQEAIR